MSKFLLTNKRAVLRSEAPFSDHFFCEKQGKGMYGVWLNIEKLRGETEDERLDIFKEILQVID